MIYDFSKVQWNPNTQLKHITTVHITNVKSEKKSILSKDFNKNVLQKYMFVTNSFECLTSALRLPL